MCEPYANPFCYYEALIDELNDIPSLNMLDGANFANCCEKDKLHVFLRHDVDSDPITALKAARYLARVGKSGSFYLLHTSPYYAECYNDVVVRNPALIHWIHGFIVSGCEVGLHNDAHGVQKLWGLDGITAIREELSWLRSQGLNIRGTVAHNSGPAYGTENYEIFEGRGLWKRKSLSPQTVLYPYEALNEAELGLSYEGTFAIPKAELDTVTATEFFANLAEADIRCENWMRTYLLQNPACDWNVDVQCWLLGKDMWVVAGWVEEVSLFEWNIGLDQLVRLLRDLPTGLRVMLVVHPEYVRG